MPQDSTIIFKCNGHFIDVSKEDIEEELFAYHRHITDDYDHIIEISPRPTPRPRAVSRKMGDKHVANVYHPSEYTKYKKDIASLLKMKRVPKGNYSSVFVTFYLPYPKSTPKKRFVEGAKHQKKPDWDNFIKGFQDALSDAGILLGDDGKVSDGAVRKRMTTQPYGFIKFNLL